MPFLIKILPIFGLHIRTTSGVDRRINHFSQNSTDNRLASMPSLRLTDPAFGHCPKFSPKIVSLLSYFLNFQIMSLRPLSYFDELPLRDPIISLIKSTRRCDSDARYMLEVLKSWTTKKFFSGFFHTIHHDFRHFAHFMPTVIGSFGLC